MKNIAIGTVIEFNEYDITDTNSEDDVFDFIVALDEACESWELTNRLYEHFKNLYEEFQTFQDTGEGDV